MAFRRWARPAYQYVVDALIWAVAVPLTTLLRYDLDLAGITWSGVFWLALIAVVAQGVVGLLFGLYRRRWRYGSFDELIGLAATVTGVGLLLTAVVFAPAAPTIPRSVPLLSLGLAVTGTISARSFRRLFLARRHHPHEADPVVVVGAGNAAGEIVRSLLNTMDAPYRPVALLDDDPLKANMRIQGVKVQGVIEDLAGVARRNGAVAVLMAIPTAERDLVRLVEQLSREAGLPMFVLPEVRDLFTAPAVADIRPVTEADLLGRELAEIDTAAVAHYITDRRVLVTGAGGSIGSELCRQLARFEPEALIMLDRDESGLHGTQLSIEGRALLNSPNLVLADIRDEARLQEVFLKHRPHVVFHAAALKHLPLLEGAPDEAWKTNVLGTQYVLAAAQAAGVDHFVNISTDKAADPVSVLGSSKRITERITSHMADQASGAYVSVRFGNVLGSRGSVLTIFREQVEQGGPLTVTHEDVTRFFMTVQEAVRLTIYAGAIGESGDVMVLDMGEPVKIMDVAKRFSRQRTPNLEIVVTGLREGEKMHEDLFGEGEFDVRPVHPLISHVPVPPLTMETVLAAYGRGELPMNLLLNSLAVGSQRREVA
ncbi:MAG: nucleoside-diphosphate sugar epimerase/dehydratase [Actinobacteria bacterium]|nr:nucleoside-diphosphate sugar epimerase/dehydratase [Actinomycetota bacterium]